MTSTTVETLQEFRAVVDTMVSTGEALDLDPCEALASFFPAIVGDEDTMGALASLLDPMIGALLPLVLTGAMTPDDAENFTHNVFHLLQISAAMGHMLGVAEAIGMAEDIPADLSAVDWGSLPDMLGEAEPEDS